MISHRLKELIRPVVFVEYFIWFTVTGSIIFYFVFVYIYVGYGRARHLGSSDCLEAVLYAAAAIITVSSILYRRYTLADERLMKILSGRIDIHKLGKTQMLGKNRRGNSSDIESLSELEKKVLSLTCDIQKNTYINLIINEAVAILGLVLAFLSGDPYRMIPFGIVSLLLNVWMFPRLRALSDKARYLFRA
jgi:hypothetical protein